MKKHHSYAGIVLLLFLLIACSSQLSCNSNTYFTNQSLKLYFGQPVSAYNSQTVAELTPIIEKWFEAWEIENPNQPHHEENYQRWKIETGNGMDYYFQEVLPNMNGGIFLSLPDGSWSTGAYGEALRLEELGKPIWSISYTGEIKRTSTEDMRLWYGGILSVEQTREKNKIPYDDLVRELKVN